MKELISYKSLFRIAVPIMLVCAIATSLWFVSPLPAKALEIEILNDQGGKTLGDGNFGEEYNFRVKVSIEDDERLPIKNINLKIYKETNSSIYTQYTNLPLGSQDYTDNTSISGTATTASIKATADSHWGYHPTGPGFVYWQDIEYTFPTTTGGYGYVVGTGTTSIIYDINWTAPPSGWTEGDYIIEATITAQDDQTFTQPSSPFTLSAIAAPPAVGGGGGGGAPPKPIILRPGVVYVSRVVTAYGEFTQDVTIESADAKVNLAIDEGTVGKTKARAPIRLISILEMAEPPAPPADASVVGLTYDLGPDGATFDPPITISFTYDPDEIPEEHNEEDLIIAMWNATAGEWVKLKGCIVDPITHTITAPVSHFTAFTVLSYTRPAAFTISSLSISPTEVDIKETLTISIVVTNIGNLSGNYEVTLKIDDVVVETQEVTVAGGASQTVPFTTAKDATGTYTVDVNGLSGTFTVKAKEVEVEVEEEVPAKPAAFTIGALTISPTKVYIGESVVISVVVTNTGDLTGSYEVTLKVDNILSEVKEVTLAGGTRQTVIFTTDKDITGTYTVNVNDLSGTFTVMTFEVTPPTGLDWWVWLIVGVTAVLAIGLLLYFLWWSQRI